MKNDFESIIGAIGASNPKISEKLPEIMKFAESSDGQRLKDKFSGSEEMKKAMENGDTCSIQSLIQTVLQTEEGKKLTKQLSDLLK